MFFKTDHQYQFAKTSMDVMYEFDKSSFISNARYAIDSIIFPLTVKGQSGFYTKILDESITQLLSVTVDCQSLTKFFVKITALPNFNTFKNKYLNYFSDNEFIGKLNTSYLDEYANKIGYLLDKAVKKTLTDDEYDKVIKDELSIKVKKQIVKTVLPYNYTAKQMLSYNLYKKELITNDTIVKTIIPFLENYKDKQKEFIEENNLLTRSIMNIFATLERYGEELTEYKKEMESSEIKKLNRFSYFLFRSALEVVSYTTYIFLRKVHIFQKRMELIATLCTDYSNFFMIDNTTEKLVNEGAFDRSITPTDTHSVSEYLMQGTIDPFAEISDDVFRQYDSLLKNCSNEMIQKYFSDKPDYYSPVDDADYQDKQYQEASKMFIEISNGLDILGKNSDDFIMIFNDLVAEAGFSIPLDDRFRSTLDMLSDISVYTSANNINEGFITDEYFKMLKEIKDYKMNMQHIASNILETKTKMNFMQKRFLSNINGEYKDAQAMKELNILMESLQEQYQNLVNIVSGKFMLRLKNLSYELETVATKLFKKNTDEVESDDVDYIKESQISDLDITEAYHDILMSNLLYEYQAARIKKEKGVQVIFEAPPTTTTQTNPEINKKDNSAGKVQVTEINQNNTNNNDAATASGKNLMSSGIKNLSGKIKAFFEKMKKDYQITVIRITTTNAKWFTEDAKQALRNRRYSNIQAEIYPYTEIAPNVILSDMKKLQSNIFAMKPAQLKTIQTKQQMYQKLFSFIKSPKEKEFKPDKTGNIDIKASIVKYYKVGAKPLATSVYQNNELKTVVLEAVEYCSSYRGTYLNSIISNIDALEKSFENVSNTFVKESFDEIITGSIFTEAGENSSQPQGNTSTSDKLEWMRSAVQTFTGSVLIACRDRYNDYIKLLYPLVPDDVKNKAKQTDTTTNQQGSPK